jgi:hypothetical protein
MLQKWELCVSTLRADDVGFLVSLSSDTDNGSTVYDEAYFTRNPACLAGGDR